MTTTVFVLLISLLLVHEMDAIRTKEWKMFIVLKDMTDETAYKIFTVIHFSLYFAAFSVMVQGRASANIMLSFVMDCFLIAHSIVHFLFRNKPNNGFSSIFSKTIIYSMGVLSVIHLFLLLLGT